MKPLHSSLKLLLSLASVLCFSMSGLAEITLPSVWSDHAVVQRGLPVHLWGSAGAGEQITVRFRNATASTAADSLGRWELYLPPGDAGGPFAMEIQGTNRIVLSDILVGDVWIASGQSNMEFRTKDVIHADEELKDAQQPTIRLFHVEKGSSDFPQEDVIATGWKPASPETVGDFSAVAYFFARNIQADQHVPVGLMEADWGGTPGESWVSLRGLTSDGSLMPAWSSWAEMSEREPEALLERAHEEQERKAARDGGRPEPSFPWHPELRSWLPAGTFNGMIAPLVKFPIRGALWCQGESNASPERS